jgi:hypothetical protein
MPDQDVTSRAVAPRVKQIEVERGRLHVMPARIFVAKFLREDGGDFCDECLAERLMLPLWEVQQATASLQGADFVSHDAWCAGCYRRRMVTEAA